MILKLLLSKKNYKNTKFTRSQFRWYNSSCRMPVQSFNIYLYLVNVIYVVHADLSNNSKELLFFHIIMYTVKKVKIATNLRSEL